MMETIMELLSPELISALAVLLGIVLRIMGRDKAAKLISDNVDDIVGAVEQVRKIQGAAMIPGNVAKELAVNKVLDRIPAVIKVAAAGKTRAAAEDAVDAAVGRMNTVRDLGKAAASPST